MQSSTRMNLEENYNYHAALAEFHKQRMEEASGGEGGEGAGEGEGGETPPAVDNTLPTAPPTNVDVPYVGGTGIPGGTLNCTMGNWEGEPTSYSYQWKSDGENVKAGSGGETYQVLPEDVGHSIACVVTATNSVGSAEAPASNAVMVAAEAAPQSRSRAARQTPQAPNHVGALPRSGARSDAKASRDATLFALHDDVAKQLRSALDAWQDAPSQEQMRSERPVMRQQSKVMAREAARANARRVTRH